jgi:hypothetical protein
MKWTIEELTKAVMQSKCYADFFRSLGLSTSSGNYRTYPHLLKSLNIDTSHFNSKSCMTKSAIFKNKIPLTEILIKDSNYANQNHLKKRLWEEGLLLKKCDKCGLGDKWQGEPIVLQIDHINGESTDNRIENLRILCPNCHSQTKTFCIGNSTMINTKPCPSCTRPISTKSTKCKSCVGTQQKRKVELRPSYEQLLKEINETNYCAVGRKYSVSDNTIRKWMTAYEKAINNR